MTLPQLGCGRIESHSAKLIDDYEAGNLPRTMCDVKELPTVQEGKGDKREGRKRGSKEDHKRWRGRREGRGGGWRIMRKRR